MTEDASALPDAPAPAETRTIEEWAEAHDVADWELRATAACNRWGIGKPLTETEFLTGLAAERGLVFR